MYGEANLRPFALDSLDYLFGLYALISSLIAEFLYPYPIVSAVIVVPNIFVIPYLLGASTFCAFSKAFSYMSRSLKFLIGFFIGCLLLSSLFILTDFLGYTIDIRIFDIVLCVAISLGFFSDSVRRMSRKEWKFDLSEYLKQTKLRLSPSAPWVLAVFIIGVLAFSITKFKVPFPYISYDHAVGQETIQPVTRLLNEGFLDVTKARALPVILQAVVCSLSGVPVSHLSWAAPLSTSLVFSFSVFSLAYCITKKRGAAVISVLFAIFLFSGGSDLFFDCVYYIFRYSTIQTAVFPLVIQGAYLYFSKVKDDKKRKPLASLFAGTILFFGTFYVFEFLQPPFLTSLFSANEYLRPFMIFIFLGLVLIWTTRIKNRALKELIYLATLFAAFSLSLDIFRPIEGVMFLFLFLFLLAQANTIASKSFQFIAAGIRIRVRALPWSTKTNLLRISAFVMLLWIIICMAGYVNLKDIPQLVPYGLDTLTKSQSLIAANSIEVMVIFFAVSVPLIFSSNLGEFALAFMSLAGLSAYFLPVEELFYVVYNISNITIGFTIAAGLFKVVGQFSHSIRIPKRARIKLKISDQSLKNVLCFSLCMIVVVPVIEASFAKFTWTGGADYRSILTDYEERAIEEYISKLPQDIRIVSDPFTMITFSSLANRVGLVEHGIAPLTEQYKSADIVSEIWEDVFRGNSSAEIYQSIMVLENVIPPDEELYVQRMAGLNLSRFMVIVSGRTSWWLDQNDPLGYCTIFPWSYNVSLPQIIHFLDPLYFNLTYTIDQKIYIFET
jgi:hypothetical protein